MKKIFYFFFFLIILILSFYNIFEQQSNNNKINNFKNKCIFNEEQSSNSLKIFNVSHETSNKTIVMNDEGEYFLGQNGDIILTNYLSFTEKIPFISELCNFYIGGHTSIVFDNYIYQSIGIGEKTGVIKEKNTILYNDSITELIGLRIKNIKEDEILKAKEYVLKQVGKKYNYFYIFNKTNKFYCNDLIVRAYGNEALLNYKLYKNKYITTTHNILNSKDIEIVFYYKKVNNIKYYYF